MPGTQPTKVKSHPREAWSTSAHTYSPQQPQFTVGSIKKFDLTKV